MEPFEVFVSPPDDAGGAGGGGGGYLVRDVGTEKVVGLLGVADDDCQGGRRVDLRHLQEGEGGGEEHILRGEMRLFSIYVYRNLGNL